ncbi:MAG: DUF3025 domain-containing protein [Zoogloea sp.]|uniref:DUF3025 domain-containing protein n=1 Tax=Zoogloea sp. TaxID=49181 RepID=UPI00261F7292|nr:DUF3025 domain-containing protein [Zoogloea sp.]MDD2991531.1 DUF3025 domain-containing protein [Zoogloea sp.]
MNPSSPAAYASRPLFEPIARLLSGFPDGLPDAEVLTACLRAHAPGAVSASGHPLHFILPPEGAEAYEQHIHATGQVPTRPHDWHDFFNALAWCVWPRSKAACNALHLQELAARAQAGLPGRGPVRDTLTQFDECGVLVVSADPDIPTLLAAHAWEEALWVRRARLLESTRFLVFGHGSWDQLRQPFFGLCAKALYRQVDAGWLALLPAVQQAEADAWLAERLMDPRQPFDKGALAPLPLLGIPGVTPDNACAGYYRDTRQFRPPRGIHRKVLHGGL